MSRRKEKQNNLKEKWSSFREWRGRKENRGLSLAEGTNMTLEKSNLKLMHLDKFQDLKVRK